MCVARVVVNLAITVVSSLTGGSATVAMTSAKLATKVAAQTLAHRHQGQLQGRGEAALHHRDAEGHPPGPQGAEGRHQIRPAVRHEAAPHEGRRPAAVEPRDAGPGRAARQTGRRLREGRHQERAVKEGILSD